MLEKARSALESFKSQWKSGEHQDDFELSMFAAAQEEYETGAGHKGLLAKVGAETSFDEKQTKASYMKARTAQLMGKKEAILGAMLKIQKLNIEIEHLQSSVILLNNDVISNESEPSQEVIDDVVDKIEWRHHYNDLEFTKVPAIGLSIFVATITYSFGLPLAASLGITNTILFSAPIAVLAAFFTGTKLWKTDIKERNQELIRYQAEIADTSEITRVALEKQNAERQGQLKSLERTEQTIKNLIATRESTASTLEGLFG